MIWQIAHAGLIVLLVYVTWLNVLDRFIMEPCLKRAAQHQQRFQRAALHGDKAEMDVALEALVTETNRMRIVMLVGLHPRELTRWFRGQSMPMSHEMGAGTMRDGNRIP